MTVIGFTGTRDGMTDAQHAAVQQIIRDLAPTVAHHGDCVGADTQFHALCRAAGCRIVGHPPDKAILRAYNECDELRAELPYLDRNRHIVNETTVLVGTPAQDHMVGRSGTWYTIRYGRRHNRQVLVVRPDGSIEDL